MLYNDIRFNLELSDRTDCANLCESFLTHITVPGFHRGKIFQAVEVAYFKKDKKMRKKENKKEENMTSPYCLCDKC